MTLRTVQWRRLGALVAMGVLAAGCASLPPTARAPGPTPETTATPLRSYHDAIEIGGRLSLRYEQNGSPQALDGKFAWNQDGGVTRITLATPFGQTLATIEVMPMASTLLQADRPARTEANVDALIAGALGWPLPIAGLRDWLQGFARSENGAAYVARPDAGIDAAYVKTADGWLLHYPVWAPATTDTEVHPRRLDLQRKTVQAGDVAVRIVIDQWQPR